MHGCSPSAFSLESAQRTVVKSCEAEVPAPASRFAAYRRAGMSHEQRSCRTCSGARIVSRFHLGYVWGRAMGPDTHGQDQITQCGAQPVHLVGQPWKGALTMNVRLAWAYVNDVNVGRALNRLP